MLRLIVVFASITTLMIIIPLSIVQDVIFPSISIAMEFQNFQLMTSIVMCACSPIPRRRAVLVDLESMEGKVYHKLINVHL
jgi:hypothetical protein